MIIFFINFSKKLLCRGKLIKAWDLGELFKLQYSELDWIKFK